jgi:hypothetical protein
MTGRPTCCAAKADCITSAWGGGERRMQTATSTARIRISSKSVHRTDGTIPLGSLSSLSQFWPKLLKLLGAQAWPSREELPGAGSFTIPVSETGLRHGLEILSVTTVLIRPQTITVACRGHLSIHHRREQGPARILVADLAQMIARQSGHRCLTAAEADSSHRKCRQWRHPAEVIGIQILANQARLQHRATMMDR